MSQTEARIQSEAEAFGEAHRDETDEERNARLAAEMQERLREVNEEMARRRGD